MNVNFKEDYIRLGSIEADYAGRKPNKGYYEQFIRDSGYLVPILVKPLQNGKYQLLDGLKRIVSIRGRIDDDTKIRAWVTDPACTAAEINELRNILRDRSDNPISDFVDVKKLLDRGVPEHEITQYVSLHPITVRTYLTINKLPPELVNGWLDERIATGTIKKIAGHGTAIAIAAAQQFKLKGKLTDGDVDDIRRPMVNSSLFEQLDATVTDDMRIAPIIVALDNAMPKGHRCRILFEDMKNLFES